MVTKTKLTKLTWNVHTQQWTTQTNIFIHLWLLLICIQYFWLVCELTFLIVLFFFHFCYWNSKRADHNINRCNTVSARENFCPLLFIQTLCKLVNCYSCCLLFGISTHCLLIENKAVLLTCLDKTLRITITICIH